MTLEDKLFSFEGRLRRRDYWLLGIGLALLQIALTQVLLFAMVGPGPTMLGGPLALDAMAAPLPSAISAIVTLLFLWPQLALTVKRKHDRGSSAVLFVVLQLFLTVSSVLPFRMLIPDAATLMLVGLAMGAAMVAIAVWLLIDLGILDGTPGPNEFGPSPKGADRTATMIAAFE
jgi:uncharacterized membrane protein YhaH (DUF805 family)